jgi:hypothetical protein
MYDETLRQILSKTLFLSLPYHIDNVMLEEKKSLTRTNTRHAFRSITNTLCTKIETLCIPLLLFSYNTR